MICLKNLSRNHSIAIITSIHQPNSNELKLFDQLYVLAIGGKCIYNGHPSALKQYLIECRIPFLDYQVPIEQLIKVASSNSNSDLINNLINQLNNDSQEELRTNEGKLVKSFSQKNKLFHFTDLIILFCRTINNELIGGWKIQIAFLINYLLIIFIMFNMFPDDIASDPGCTQERIDLTNISLINQKILDALTGNEQKYQQNIKYYFYVLAVIHLLTMIQICYSYGAQVIFINMI